MLKLKLQYDIAAGGQQDALDHVVNRTVLLLNAAQAAAAEPALAQGAPIREASVLLRRPASIWLRCSLLHCSASPDGLQEKAPLLSDPPRHRARLKTRLLFGELRVPSLPMAIPLFTDPHRVEARSPL